VIVDGELLYLGSANWTGAGLGAKGSGRRNFEVGVVTDDAQLLDQIQALYERIWSGGECASCKLHDECPGPLAELSPIVPVEAVAKRRKSRKKTRR
jgi:phosphatidylserine/phosphatidylglycerophosphate/cardiolipin synthase-like enzyme